jgi:hypothetical protein
MMSFATDKWFRHLREELLTEGLGDIGLSEDNVSRIRMELPDASEKGRVWVGNALKEYGLRGYRLRIQSLEEYRDIVEAYKSHFQKGDFNILTQYANTISGQPIKKWPKAKKSFIKNSRKLGVSNAIINTVTLFVDEVEGKVFSEFVGKIENVVITLNQNPNNYEIIKDNPPSDWEAAEKECYEFQQNQEDPDQILHTFEDGSYWYDLQSSHCSMEGDRMGHCGQDHRGTLYSLRKKDKGKKFSKSYVTISYNEGEETIFQIKGRNNDAPPNTVWDHISWFIDNSDTAIVEEAGEHSNDEEGFREMIDWLKDASPRVSFSNSMEDMLAEYTSECEDYRRRFDDEQVDMIGLETEPDGGGPGGGFFWMDGIRSLSMKISGVLPEDLLGWRRMPEELAEEIVESLRDEDTNDVLDDFDAEELFFTKANSYEDSLAKAHDFQTNTVNGEVKRGTGTYMVLMNLEQIVRDSHDYNTNYGSDQAESYEEYLDMIETLVSDVNDAADSIEDDLIKAGVMAKPKVKGYVEKIEEEFNNFQISTTKTHRGEYNIIATGIAFTTTQDEMDTLLGPVSFVEAFLEGSGYQASSGYFTSGLFKGKVIAELNKKEKEATDFAKRQMKLNYGEQYEERIETLWDKIGADLHNKLFVDSMFVGFGIKKAPRRAPTRIGSPISTENYFSYKMEVILNEETLPLYGPFLEYYDNNFELVVNAFGKVIKEEISEAVDKFKKTTGSDTNLPLQEAESLLDVRVYEVDFVMSYPLGLGFEITDIHNIIRAIPDVTTIRSIGNAKRTQGNRTVSLQHLKFALQGQKNRTEWLRQILLPQIHKIDSKIKIHRVERADLVSTSKSLRENWGGSSQRPTQAMRTPRATVQQTLADWVQGGVMYDMPMHTNLSSYHVMVPVEELEPFMNREPRKHGHHFDAGYENFIANGPLQPIYLAIGKNGRAKITGNEDDLRYALKAGVKEVPVFFSYQRQV